MDYIIKTNNLTKVYKGKEVVSDEDLIELIKYIQKEG